MGKICWGGHRGKVTTCLRANFITAESTTTASCCLPCAGITAALSPLCSVILTEVTTIVPACRHCRIHADPGFLCKEFRQTTLTRMLGSCPTWSEHMCVASLSAAVTVGGKVKAMKCLGSNRAWLKQSPWPGREANFMRLARLNGW